MTRGRMESHCGCHPVAPPKSSGGKNLVQPYPKRRGQKVVYRNFHFFLAFGGGCILSYWKRGWIGCSSSSLEGEKVQANWHEVVAVVVVFFDTIRWSPVIITTIRTKVFLHFHVSSPIGTQSRWEKSFTHRPDGLFRDFLYYLHTYLNVLPAGNKGDVFQCSSLTATTYVWMEIKLISWRLPCPISSHPLGKGHLNIMCMDWSLFDGGVLSWAVSWWHPKGKHIVHHFHSSWRRMVRW